MDTLTPIELQTLTTPGEYMNSYRLCVYIGGKVIPTYFSDEETSTITNMLLLEMLRYIIRGKTDILHRKLSETTLPDKVKNKIENIVRGFLRRRGPPPLSFRDVKKYF